MPMSVRLKHCGFSNSFPTSCLEEGLNLVHRSQLSTILIDHDVTNAVYFIQLRLSFLLFLSNMSLLGINIVLELIAYLGIPVFLNTPKELIKVRLDGDKVSHYESGLDLIRFFTRSALLAKQW